MITIIIWLYGAPYSGKTTFANKFPKPFFISLDKNAQYITDDYINVSNVDDYFKAVKDFMKDPQDYETLVVDNIDLLEQMMRRYYLDKFGIEDEGDRDDYGKTWRLIREGTYQNVMIATTGFTGDVILISQEDEFVTKTKLGMEINNYRPGINKKLHDRIGSLTTLIIRAFKDAKRVKGEEIVSYKISMGHYAEELSGTRIPLKETLITNDYDEFKQSIGGK